MKSRYWSADFNVLVPVEEKVIPNILKVNLKNSEQNGKDKIRKNKILKNKKIESIINLQEHSKQMIKEQTHGEDLKKLVMNEERKITYAEVLVKGTKGTRKGKI